MYSIKKKSFITLKNLKFYLLIPSILSLSPWQPPIFLLSPVFQNEQILVLAEFYIPIIPEGEYADLGCLPRTR